LSAARVLLACAFQLSVSGDKWHRHYSALTRAAGGRRRDSNGVQVRRPTVLQGNLSPDLERPPSL